MIKNLNVLLLPFSCGSQRVNINLLQNGKFILKENQLKIKTLKFDFCITKQIQRLLPKIFIE